MTLMCVIIKHTRVTLALLLTSYTAISQAISGTHSLSRKWQELANDCHILKDLIDDCNILIKYIIDCWPSHIYHFQTTIKAYSIELLLIGLAITRIK